MTVERFKRRFAQRLTNNLYVAESIIYSALREDGYSDAAARAEVARFAHDITRVVKAFAQEADTNTAVAEEIGQAQDEIGLAKITPVQTKGIA